MRRLVSVQARNEAVFVIVSTSGTFKIVVISFDKTLYFNQFLSNVMFLGADFDRQETSS